MNIDLLDGYEFEELVCRLFQKMGFIAEQTKLSGDGGVDIIATSTAPIYRGTYLVQCKRFSSAVGEPVVRDLFGVVTSQNANKGIVVTNSVFSKAAVEFAEGKNIELVDGDGLSALLYQYGLIENTQPKNIHFTDLSSFDSNKYNYLKKLVATNKTKQEPYFALFNFLYEYILSGNTDVMYGGLLLECLQLSEEIVKRFSRKKNKIEEEQLHIQCFLQLLLGNVEKVFEISKLNCFSEYLGNSYQWGMGPIFSHVRYRGIEPGHRVRATLVTTGFAADDFYRNLLITFLHLDYTEGAAYCKQLLDDSFISRKDGHSSKDGFVHDYPRVLQYNVELFGAQYEAVLSKTDSKICGVDNHAQCSDTFTISIEDIVSKWPADVNIQKQLENITMMLDF